LGDRTWLIAEDDPIFRSILSALTTLWDINAVILEDGFQVWAWLDKVEAVQIRPPLPEVALLDIRMAGHSGPEIGSRMRHIPALAAMPILIMTAYRLSETEKAEIYRDVQPAYLIEKPIPSPDQLRDMIEDAIATSAPKTKTDPHLKLSPPIP
jgi:CheY-like chemotaxis protein